MLDAHELWSLDMDEDHSGCTGIEVSGQLSASWLFLIPGLEYRDKEIVFFLPLHKEIEMKAQLPSTLLASLMLGIALNADAADQQRDRERIHQTDQAQTQTQNQVEKQDVIYGSQLMTLKERQEYQAKMRSLKTAQEREAFRKEHHEQMKARAKAMGKTLPDEPPAVGAGEARARGTGRWLHNPR